MWKKKIDKENKSLSWRSDILPAPTREIKSTKAKRYKTGRKERRVQQTSLSPQPLHAESHSIQHFDCWKNDNSRTSEESDILLEEVWVWVLVMPWLVLYFRGEERCTDFIVSLQLSNSIVHTCSMLRGPIVSCKS